jgi:SAM-dependent methyltransferase
MSASAKPQRHRHGPGVERLRHARHQEGFVARYLSGNAILDIGFRGGVPDAVPVVHQAIGIELDYPGYDGTHLPFPPGSQDTVFVSHCLEHIVNYREVLADWYRVLKVEGYLIVVVPHQYLYERKATLPSRFNRDHKRFYTSGSLLAEVEESLPIAGFRIRSLREIDTDFNYSLAPEQHAKGCYDIEVVIQKLNVPRWALTLTLGEAERASLGHYVEMILALSRQELASALEAAKHEAELVQTISLPPFAVILQQLRKSEIDMKFLRQVLEPFVARKPFDADYYRGRYPDLQRADSLGQLNDLHRHYVKNGYFEGRCGDKDDPWVT